MREEGEKRECGCRAQADRQDRVLEAGDTLGASQVPGTGYGACWATLFSSYQSTLLPPAC